MAWHYKEGSAGRTTPNKTSQKRNKSKRTMSSTLVLKLPRHQFGQSSSQSVGKLLIPLRLWVLCCFLRFCSESLGVKIKFTDQHDEWVFGNEHGAEYIKQTAAASTANNWRHFWSESEWVKNNSTDERHTKDRSYRQQNNPLHRMRSDDETWLI